MLKASVFLVVFMRLAGAAVWGEIVLSEMWRKRKPCFQESAQHRCAGNAVTSRVMVVEINSKIVA